MVTRISRGPWRRRPTSHAHGVEPTVAATMTKDASIVSICKMLRTRRRLTARVRKMMMLRVRDDAEAIAFVAIRIVVWV